MTSTRRINGHKQRDLEGLIDLYVLRCQVEGKSPRTVAAYAETLRRFARIAGEEGLPREVDAIESVHLYAYLGRYTNHSMETRHCYFREVRCFFNWLIAAGYLEETPFRALRNVRLPQRIVRPFSLDEMARLLACLDPGSAIGSRDQAILFTLLDTGIRCSELVQLNLEDLDLTAGRLRVLHAKGNRQRVVPFASRCREAIVAYLRQRGSVPGPLFLALGQHREMRTGVVLKPNGLKQMLRRLGRQAGMPKVHAHRFRHSFATWAIEHDARWTGMPKQSRSWHPSLGMKITLMICLQPPELVHGGGVGEVNTHPHQSQLLVHGRGPPSLSLRAGRGATIEDKPKGSVRETGSPRAYG
jgi:site-specific recombinase XerD